MKDWNKLSKEFDDLLATFTKKDWDDWMKGRSLKRKERANKLKNASCATKP